MTAQAAKCPRRIGVLTTGRHDWGYLLPVAEAIANHPALAPTIFCTGTHLHPAFGATADAVHAAGLDTVDVPLFPAADPGDSGEIAAEYLPAMAARLIAAMHECSPEVVVVLGDRIETLVAATMVIADGRVLAHIHGGDRAAGELDDANRHAVTKLSHVHFPATSEASERIVRMGESADRVWSFGSPGIDSILAGGVATPAEARAAAGLAADVEFVLVLQHPAGLGAAAEAAEIGEILQGIHSEGLTAVLIGPNPDVGSDAIRDVLQKFSSLYNWPIVPSVDRRIFLRLMADAIALVGNSSSGMVESAAVDAVVVNVGARQNGRQHSANVIDVGPRRERIAAALRRLRTDPPWRASLRAAPCVFGDGHAAGRIADVLAAMDISNQRRIKLNEY